MWNILLKYKYKIKRTHNLNFILQFIFSHSTWYYGVILSHKNNYFIFSQASFKIDGQICVHKCRQQWWPIHDVSHNETGPSTILYANPTFLVLTQLNGTHDTKYNIILEATAAGCPSTTIYHVFAYVYVYTHICTHPLQGTQKHTSPPKNEFLDFLVLLFSHSRFWCASMNVVSRLAHNKDALSNHKSVYTKSFWQIRK